MPRVKGFHHSEETKTKISTALKGKHISEETKAKISKTTRRKYKSKSGVEIRAAQKRGAKLTEEHKLHLSQSSRHGFIKLSIDGKAYDSIAEASRELGIRYHILVRIVNYSPEELEELGHHLDWIEQK